METQSEDVLFVKVQELKKRLLSVQNSTEYANFTSREKKSLENAVLLINDLEKEIFHGKRINSSELVFQALKEITNLFHTR